MPTPQQPPSLPDSPKASLEAGRGTVLTPPSCTWPHGDPQVTALPWDRALSGRGGPHSPCPNPKHHRAQLQHHVLPGCLPKCPPYMYIYTTKPQNTRYIEIPTRGRPHTNSSRNPLRRGGMSLPPPLPTAHSPSLACRGGGSPDKGTLQGTAQTQPRGAGDTGLGAAEAAQSPPTSTDTGDQRGGTGQNEQTNNRQRDEAEQGGLPWSQLPPQARSQPQVGVRGGGSGWDWHR